MRRSARASLACLLALVLPQPAPALAQAAGDEPALAGGWSGWATLSNEWPGLDCRYESGPGSETVRLELSGDVDAMRGSVAIDMPAPAGSDCPPLRKRHAIGEVTAAAGTVAFTDSGGNEWTLTLRRRGAVLQGLVAWRTGGADEPLAEGFTTADGRRPLSRLSGEVRLQRGPSASAAAAAAGGGSAAAPAAGGGATGGGAPAGAPRTTSAGTHAKHLAAVLAANVVGLGLVYGANQLGQGSSESGTLTCSPRVCRAGVPGDPCVCEPAGDPHRVSGASCGSTRGGVETGGVCNGRDLPCKLGLSCDLVPPATEYLCWDPAAGGRCPI